LKYKELLKNEWVKTGILLAIVIIAFFSIWFGIRFALDTDYPLLAVASGSMVPALPVGALIVVQGISNFSAVYAHPVNGDIIVFHTYMPSGPSLLLGHPDEDELIVHRAISKNQSYDSYLGKEVWYFTTKGDANGMADPGIILATPVPQNYVVGKVVGSVPDIGYIPLDIRTTTGIETVIILIILVLFVEIAYSSFKEKRKPPIEAQS
jgi:signal peptidase